MSSDETPKVETEPKSEVAIKPYSPEQEVERITETLAKMDWYKQHGYTPKLPNLEEISLPPDKEALLNLVKQDYKPEVYKGGISLLEAHREQIESVVFPTFSQLNELWGFKTFPEYQVMITRYGMVGSYNSDKGRIVMRVNDDGSFPGMNPLHTITHEMVHIGIEEVIVEKFNLTQSEKELLVDLMVSILFAESIPDYKFQRIGDKRITPFVTPETIANLPEATSRYVSTYPREQK